MTQTNAATGQAPTQPNYAGADSTGPLTRPATAGALNSAPAPSAQLDPEVLKACKATLACLDFEHARLYRHYEATGQSTQNLRYKVCGIAESLEMFIAAMERP